MIYLTDIEFKEKFRSLKEGLTIKFKDVTLLVGNQGCGKSTILELLRDDSPKLKKGLTKETINKGVKTFYFDSEKMNPRINGIDKYSNPNGTSRGIGVGKALQSHFMSHGEVLQQFTVHPLKLTQNSVLFLDEPESSLSLYNQFKLIENIKIASKTCQLIVATHCYPLIKSFDEVYDLENKMWVKSNDYLKQFSL